MRDLDPNSPRDRAITAFTRTFEIKTFPNGDILMGIYSYDCWGDMQGGLFKQRATKDLFNQKVGQKSHLSLKLMQAGCCPPQLASQMLGDEDSPGAKGDAIEEAYKLHKRGYLGGGG